MEKIAAVQAQAYEGTETQEEMYANIKVINKNAEEVSKRIPMINGKE